jgi:hypothetical protein
MAVMQKRTAGSSHRPGSLDVFVLCGSEGIIESLFDRVLIIQMKAGMIDVKRV